MTCSTYIQLFRFLWTSGKTTKNPKIPILVSESMENPKPNRSLSHNGSNNSSPRETNSDPSAAVFSGDIRSPPSRLKLIISYNGRIQPRQQENSLVYVGGESKLLAVDRSFRYPSLFSKLRSLFGSDDFVAKYQLPGEDLDSLISVTNEEDMENMLAEYDRICRFSKNPKQSVRLRMFLFNVASGGMKKATSSGKSEPDLNKVSLDYLLGLDADPVPAKPKPEMAVMQAHPPPQKATFGAPQGFVTVGADGNLYHVFPAASGPQGVFGNIQSAIVPQVYGNYYAPKMEQVSGATHGSRPVYFAGADGNHQAVSSNVAFCAEGSGSLILKPSRVSS